MSEREMLLHEIESIPDYQVRYLLGVIHGLNAEIPNDATIEAMKEMENGQYKEFDTVDELFADLGI